MDEGQAPMAEYTALIELLCAKRSTLVQVMAANPEQITDEQIRQHMLRHACGFYLTNQGYDLRLIQDYLGHRDPKHTVHYTCVAGSRFEGLWR